MRIELPLAIDRSDIAGYVDGLFLVYTILIFARILLSWIYTIRGSLPYNPALRAITEFVQQTTDPYLNLFRRFLPPLRLGGMGLDLSPIVALIVLFIIQAIVVGLIEG